MAGFFDGEGTACVGRNNKMILSFSNTHLQVLQRIRKFLGYGNIHITNKMHGSETHLCHQLAIQHHEQILIVAKRLLRHCIVKRLALQKLIKAIELKQWRVSGETLRRKLPPKTLRNLYWHNQLSTPKIAKRFGTSSREVLNIMDEYRIARRTLSESTTLVWRQK